jgi:hypothetical protein
MIAAMESTTNTRLQPANADRIGKISQRLGRVARSLTFGTVLLAPVTAMSAPTENPDAVPVPLASATSPGTQAQPPQALDLTPPAIDTLLTSEQLADATKEAPAASSDPSIEAEPVDAQPMPIIVVQAGAADATTSETPTAPCGLVGIVWALNHPADAWRILAPVPADSSLVACFNAASGGGDASQLSQ